MCAGEDVRCAMSVSIAEIVRRTIRHARSRPIVNAFLRYSARVALVKILADLEARSPGDPSLERLRHVIERLDRAWTLREDETK